MKRFFGFQRLSVFLFSDIFLIKLRDNGYPTWQKISFVQRIDGRYFQRTKRNRKGFKSESVI